MARGKENYVILKKKASHFIHYQNCDHSTFLPINALIHAHSTLCKSNLTSQLRHRGVLVRQEPGLRTIKALDHQAGTSSQSDSQGCLTTRPIIPSNCVRFIYSDTGVGLYPLSAWPPGGLRLRHRRFKQRGAVGSRWADSPKPCRNIHRAPTCLRLLTHILHPDTWRDYSEHRASVSTHVQLL